MAVDLSMFLVTCLACGEHRGRPTLEEPRCSQQAKPVESPITVSFRSKLENIENSSAKVIRVLRCSNFMKYDFCRWFNSIYSATDDLLPKCR